MKSITIIGKRWFDKVNGNTYFSAVGLIDGIQKVLITYNYGYGNQFESEVFEMLEKHNFIKDVEHYSNGNSETLWNYCNRKKINKAVYCIDVARKKDLKF